MTKVVTRRSCGNTTCPLVEVFQREKKARPRADAVDYAPEYEYVALKPGTEQRLERGEVALTAVPGEPNAVATWSGEAKRADAPLFDRGDAETS